ncbi:PAS-domain containing protein [Roseococcus suduntuyensis]|uniref:histidine kinase n=1 Tax=Roseococcus suduntuyensis TaxID=455361 RepID=A0A840AAQ9_9PROT|nr:PAS-domain containing protein [Roseococcus suduntuyensis]MBB3897300.1 PAS domain-containing protein [Roseococcus suduntuyensis]
MNAEAPRDPRPAILAALPVALLAFDSEDRVILANPALHGLVDTGPEVLRPGLTRAEVLQILAFAGLFGTGNPTELAARMLDAPAGRGARLRTAGGRRVEWVQVPLTHGGCIIALPETTELAQALDSAQQELRDLNAVLQRLSSGVAVYGDDQRLRFTNTAFPALVGLQPSEALPGAHFLELNEAQARRGEHPPNWQETLRERMKDPGWRNSPAWERRRPNGQTIRFRNQLLPDGGWLSEVTDITKEREAAEEAQRRIALQDALLEALPVGVAVYGPDRVLRYINPAYHEIFASMPARVGEHLRDILTRRALAGEFGAGDAEQQVTMRLDRLNKPFSFERYRNGRTTVHRSVPLPDGGHAMVVADVSELNAAQAEILAREQLLTTTLEATRHGIVMFDDQSRVILANRLAAHFCGLSPENFARGTHVSELRRRQYEKSGEHQPRDPQLAKQQTSLEEWLNAPLFGPHQYRRAGENGTVVEVITDTLPGGGFVRSYSDVTALARAEAEATSRAAMLQTVLDSMRHGVILYDQKGYVRVANTLGGTLAGLPVEALKPGVHFDTLRDIQAERGEHGPHVSPEEYRRRRTPEPWKGDSTYTRQRPDGTVVEVRTDVTPGGGCVRTFTDITALTEAQAEVSQRNVMMQVMLENMRHGIAMFDAEHRLLVANTLCARLNGVEGLLHPGMTRTEMARLQAAQGEFGPPEQAEEALRQLDARDFDAPQAWQRHRPDGTVVEIRTNPVPGGGFVLTLTDVTERVRAQEESQARASVLTATLNASRHSITLFDADGRVVACNDMAAERSGFPNAQAPVGMTHAEVIAQARRAQGGPPDLPPTLAFDVIDRSKPMRYQRRGSDGRVLDVASDPVPGGGYVVTIADVTELFEAREEAQRRAGVLAAALNATRHTITLYDAEHRAVAANRIAAELAGYADERDLIGLTITEILQHQAENHFPGDLAAQAAFMSQYAGLDRTKSLRYQRRHPDGRVLDVQSEPTHDGGFAVSVADVTALVQAQEEAQRRAGVLQAMLDNNRHGIVLYDADHRLVAANALAGELMGVPDLLQKPGISQAEVLAAQRARGMYADDEDGGRTERGFLELDRSKPQRMQRTLPDGRRFDIASDPTPDGGFVISIADVTALARAEEEAEHRAGIMQTMLDNISLGILLYDKERRLVALNDLATEALGLPDLTNLRGRTMEEILQRQFEAGNFGTGAVAEALLRHLIEQDRSVPQFHQRVTADGRVLNNASHPTPDGGYVVSITDVTALAEAQAEADRRATILGVMLDNIRHGIVLFDADGLLVAANPMVSRMLDLPPGLLAPGMTVHGLVQTLHARGEYGKGEDAERIAADIAIHPREASRRQIRRRPDGTILEIVSDPTPDGGFVLTYTDVTDDRRIRDELERARTAAEAASLAKSRFLATMSHELRTPLNAVIGFSEVLSGDAPREQTQEFARAIQEAGRHLLTLIDDILDVTRAESGHLPVTLETIPLPPLLEGVERMMRPTAEAGRLTLQLVPMGPLPRLRADEQRLRQVLLNLVTNAVKFTPAGGRITLTARICDKGLEIEVRDTGIGIAADDLSRVFEPFTQIDSQLARRYPGAGLGLYLCRVLTEAQGGTLTLDSAEGEGTRALLRFPHASLLP